jgi:GTP cyclohydrolase I/GTP cyclohydrolase-4
MLEGVSRAFPSIEDSSFVMARQENFETIHQHNVVAERYGLIGEVRAELASGAHSSHHATMREWLENSST